MSKISLTTSLGVSAATTPRRDGTSSTLPIKAWRPTSPNDTSDGSAAWATVLSPDASRAFVDREHLALLPHRDLLDRPSNRGIRTTPREEPMTTSIRKGSSLCPENGRAPNPTSHQDSGHRYGAFMECHEEGPPRRRHSPVM